MFVPSANNELTFEITGRTILGTGNGNLGDHDSEKTNKRCAFNGLCQVIARADGKVCLTVKSDGLEKGELKIK